MNSLAAIVGYIALGLAVLLGIAIAVGKFFARKADAVLDDWDPAPRNLTPHVPPQWQRPDGPLRDTPPPSDPAS